MNQQQSAVGGGYQRQLPRQQRAAGIIEYHPTEGYHFYSPPPPSSPLTRRQMGSHAARQGLAHQSSTLPSDGAIGKFLAASHADNFIRWREIGYRNLEKAHRLHRLEKEIFGGSE